MPALGATLCNYGLSRLYFFFSTCLRSAITEGSDIATDPPFTPTPPHFWINSAFMFVFEMYGESPQKLLFLIVHVHC